MAFAGTMGAAASMTPIGVLSAPGGALAYNADGIRLEKTPVGTSTAVLRPRLANLRLTIGTQQDEADPLGALVVGAPDPNNADTGALVTAAPGADQHGIPTNFGPGRGNWTQDDLERLRVIVQSVFYVTFAVTEVGTVVSAERILAGGDLTLTFRNMCENAVFGLVIDLEWRHSIQVA